MKLIEARKALFRVPSMLCLCTHQTLGSTDVLHLRPHQHIKHLIIAESEFTGAHLTADRAHLTHM
jgi:hypothetical protein